MLTSLKTKFGFRKDAYPPQFWLMFWGMLISTIGMSMVWPFLVVYARGRLGLSLTTVASLFTLSSIMGIISSLAGGPVIDRFGRKWVMIISLALNGVGYFFLSQAHTFVEFAVIMGLNGAINPLYRVAADAMMADLIPAPQRPDAYSILRMANNIGISVGPAIGGFLAAISYSITFSLAAAGLVAYSLLMLIFAAETMPAKTDAAVVMPRERFGGYGKVFANIPFISMVGGFTLVTVCASLIWVLLADYSKTNYGVSESMYGWIPTTNALMVVFFQLGITQVTKRFQPLLVMAVGSFFYGLANLGIAFGSSFGAFWLCMVVMTLGELALAPTTSTYAANLAPVDQRARYMSLFGLTWGVASGIGPVFGGILSDHFGPKMIWYGGTLVGICSVIFFLVLERYLKTRQKLAEVPAST